MSQNTRKLLLCADDFGISPGINQGITYLASKSRLSAVSCMSVAQYFEEAAKNIQSLHLQVALGLHITLTYLPSLSTGKRMVPEVTLLKQTWLRQIDKQWLYKEMDMQFQRFIDVFGMAPDFVDGHQHVHVLPVVRDIFFALREKYAPNSWVRNVVDIHGLEKKRAILAVMGWRFLQQLRSRKIRHNTAIYGFYDYTRPQQFEQLFAQWVSSMSTKDISLCYVHPGFPDATLAQVDTVTTPRQKEYQFFDSEAFLTMQEKSFTLVNTL